MTNGKTAIANHEAAGKPNPSCSHKTAKLFISRERRFQDALEDDEVREALQGFRQLPGNQSAKKVLAK